MGANWQIGAEYRAAGTSEALPGNGVGDGSRDSHIGHQGKEKTRQRVLRLPSVFKDIEDYCRSCRTYREIVHTSVVILRFIFKLNVNTFNMYNKSV